MSSRIKHFSSAFLSRFRIDRTLAIRMEFEVRERLRCRTGREVMLVKKVRETTIQSGCTDQTRVGSMHWHWHRSDWSILGWRIYRWVKLSWRRRSDPFSSSAVSAGRRVREDILLHRPGPGTASHARKACRAKKTCGAPNKFLHHRVTSSTRCLCPSSRKSNNNRGAHPSHTAHREAKFF